MKIEELKFKHLIADEGMVIGKNSGCTEEFIYSTEFVLNDDDDTLYLYTEMPLEVAEAIERRKS